MEAMANLSIWIAFGAGILSFISPCTLPLYPAYLSYITGISVQDMKNNPQGKTRLKVMLHSLFFLLGISIIYIVLVMSVIMSAGIIEELFFEYKQLLRQVSGVLIVLMGLFLVGFLKLEWLIKERKFTFSNKPVGYIGTIFIGMGFAAGWTPCMGPIISLILVLAANEPSQGLTYMIAYIIGFSVPFFVLSFFISSTRWIVRYSSLIMKIGGAVMIIMGVLLYTDQTTKIVEYLQKLIQGTWFGNLG